MLLTQCDDMVDAFATDRSNQPLGKRVLPQRAAMCGEWLRRCSNADRTGHPSVRRGSRPLAGLLDDDGNRSRKV